MARIPEDEVARLQREVSVEKLVEAAGVTIVRDGANLTGRCPFHGDDDIELTIAPKPNTWSCARCGIDGGSGIEWVMKSEGISFRHAAELLRRDYAPMIDGSTKTTTTDTPPKNSSKTKLPKLVASDLDDDRLLLRIVDYYHDALKESPEALGYLATRGLNNAEVIQRFKIGFANRTLGYRLPERHRREGEHIRSRLQKLGILRSTGHEHFNGSVTIPMFDADGVRVVGIYGRKITSGLRDGTPLHLQIPEQARAVFNELGLAGGDVVLTKSIIDALTFWCAGVRNVTAAYGVKGFMDIHREAFTKYGVRRVFVAFDRSRAADNAAETIETELNAMGIETFRVLLPKGMDVNEYASKTPSPEKSLAALIRNAEWTGKGKQAVTVPEDIGVTSNDDQRVDPVVTPMPVTEPATTVNMTTSMPMIATDTRTDEVVITFGDRRWRVRGLQEVTSHGDLWLNLMVSREGAGFHVDSLDLYSSKQRALFVKQAAIEIAVTETVIKKELGTVLLEVEARVDEQIRAKLKPVEPTPVMTETEREEALGLLRDPKLVERIVADFDHVGLVGEDANKLLGYVAAISRKLEDPLAVVIQSSSSAGKSSLMDAVLTFVPEEDRISFSAMTGQALYYMGGRDLRHKVLSVAEGEGAERAAYPLKILQSEGSLVIASTGKDPQTGKLVAHEYRVTGPVMTFLTTTAIDLDEELTNRCLVLTVDEGRDQTRRVHVRQRSGQTLAGLLARRDRERVVRLHRNAQRLLRPILVVNPFAESLSFSDGRTRSRRDHMKFLGVIRAIALLFQHQRVVKVVEHGGDTIEYIEVSAADIELASRLLHDVLGRDELPPVTANVLTAIESFVKERATTMDVPASEVSFSQREIREALGLSATQLKVHMKRLEELEHLVVRRDGRRFVYGLLGYDGDRSGENAIGRGSVGAWSGAGPDREGVRDTEGKDAFEAIGRGDQNRVKGSLDENPSYRT